MSTNIPIGPLFPARIPDLLQILEDREVALEKRLFVAAPGIITQWDSVKQLASIQIAVTQQFRIGNLVQTTNGGQYLTTQIKTIPVSVLNLVPICPMRGGGFSVTLPIAVGDEVLVVFANNCIDQWKASGCAQNELGNGYVAVNEIEQRRHDPTDAFFIPGPWNQTRTLSAYSATNLEIRSDTGTVKISLSPSGNLTITGANVAVNASGNLAMTADGTISLMSSGALNITGAPVNIVSTSGQTSIDGKAWDTHQHTLVTPGSGDTGPVL